MVWVPGSFEIPIVAQEMAKSKMFDAVLCIGVVVSRSAWGFGSGGWGLEIEIGDWGSGIWGLGSGDWGLGGGDWELGMGMGLGMGDGAM